MKSFWSQFCYLTVICWLWDWFGDNTEKLLNYFKYFYDRQIICPSTYFWLSMSDFFPKKSLIMLFSQLQKLLNYFTTFKDINFIVDSWLSLTSGELMPGGWDEAVDVFHFIIVSGNLHKIQVWKSRQLKISCQYFLLVYPAIKL